MRDSSILVSLCLVLAVHLLVGITVLRKITGFAPLAIVDLAVGLAVLSYWLGEWYGYLFKGIQWRAIDQLVPLYALAVCVLSVVYLLGKNTGTLLHGCVFVAHMLITGAAIAFFALFKIDKLF